MRSRSCNNPPPRNGGLSCVAQGYGNNTDMEDCELRPCPGKLTYVYENEYIYIYIVCVYTHLLCLSHYLYPKYTYYSFNVVVIVVFAVFAEIGIFLNHD